jgi:hypothetical protein
MTKRRQRSKDQDFAPSVSREPLIRRAIHPLGRCCSTRLEMPDIDSIDQ